VSLEKYQGDGIGIFAICMGISSQFHVKTISQEHTNSMTENCIPELLWHIHLSPAIPSLTFTPVFEDKEIKRSIQQFKL